MLVTCCLRGISVSEAFLDSGKLAEEESAPPLATPQKTEKKRSAQEEPALDGDTSLRGVGL